MRRILALTLAIGAIAATPVDPAEARYDCRKSGTQCSGGSGGGAPGGGGGGGGMVNYAKGTSCGGGGGNFAGTRSGGGGFRCDSDGCKTGGKRWSS